ncbi:MAG: P1 family peptidase, partial [Gemmatimonadetes bacterium]|nr:P1 family peptidase [Gemmatimonadota bacterium]
PLLPHQLERIVRRVGMGLGRLGSWAANGSGDLFLAFSTANREDAGAANYVGQVPAISQIKMLANEKIDGFFRATIDATEEAVVNAMLAAETTTGADGIRAHGLPGDRVVAALRKYGRMR